MILDELDVETFKSSKEEKKVTVSPYMMMYSWLRDGSLDTPIPEICLQPGAIPQILLLNHFEASPKYFVTINKIFNTPWIFALRIKDILKLMKQLIYYTSYYKSKTASKAPKVVENKLCKLLRDKYPYYRKEEISMIVDYIDKHSDIQETIYEQFDLRTTKAKKIAKSEYRKKMDNVVSAQSLLDDL